MTVKPVTPKAEEKSLDGYSEDGFESYTNTQKQNVEKM